MHAAMHATMHAAMQATTLIMHACASLQIRFFAANGFYVVLDNQFNLDTTAKDDPAQWLTWWKQLLSDVILDPQSRNQVMVDLLNEPDSQYYG